MEAGTLLGEVGGRRVTQVLLDDVLQRRVTNSQLHGLHDVRPAKSSDKAEDLPLLGRVFSQYSAFPISF